MIYALDLLAIIATCAEDCDDALAHIIIVLCKVSMAIVFSVEVKL